MEDGIAIKFLNNNKKKKTRNMYTTKTTMINIVLKRFLRKMSSWLRAKINSNSEVLSNYVQLLPLRKNMNLPLPTEQVKDYYFLLIQCNPVLS